MSTTSTVSLFLPFPPLIYTLLLLLPVIIHPTYPKLLYMLLCRRRRRVFIAFCSLSFSFFSSLLCMITLRIYTLCYIALLPSLSLSIPPFLLYVFLSLHLNYVLLGVDCKVGLTFHDKVIHWIFAGRGDQSPNMYIRFLPFFY